MNKSLIAQMCLDKQALANFWELHRRFSRSKKYKLKNMIKCGLHVIRHDRLVKHEGQYILNSFIPPLNSPAFLNIALHVPGEGADFFENHCQGKRLAPISAYIAVTGRCKYNCWHCSASAANRQEELDTEDMLEIVGKLQELGVGIIGFTGGEPLLRADLEQLIASINEKSVSLVFSTGYNLTLKRAESLKTAGLLGIAISLDSVSEEKHDRLRGYQGAYQQAIQAIRNAKKAGLYTMSQTVGRRELLAGGEIFQLAKMLKQEGVDEMRIIEPLPCGKLSRQPEAVLSPEEQSELKNLHLTLNHDQQYPKASVFPYFESAEQFGCGAACQHSYVDQYGNFGPCDFLGRRYGNILSENIQDLWQKMHTELGRPRCACLAKKPAQSEQRLPKFYRLLAGDLE
ncbi:MAG: radical SAM protein [Desulfitobacteriia bacterium]|jgi:MoaA/NifB/PqqE/SkfB family radical SAM enzyme